MAIPYFEGDIPRSEIKRSEQLEKLKPLYGNFAIATLSALKEKDTSAPDDILTVGNNWFQLVNTYDQPRSDSDRMLQQQGATIFGDMWQIMGRKTGDNIYAFMQLIRKGVGTRSLDDRILSKLAVLDLSTLNQPISTQDLVQTVDTPLGVNGVLKGTTTTIYHIRGGFYTQQIEDKLGSPDDDLSVSIFKPGKEVL